MIGLNCRQFLKQFCMQSMTCFISIYLKFLFLIFLGIRNIYLLSHFIIFTLIPKFVDCLMKEEYT